MRETLARVVAGSITGLLVVLAALFAYRRNDVGGPTVAESSRQVARPSERPPRSLDPDVVARGRLVFEKQRCARCHAAEGRGNPRLPLDGVGTHRTADELRAWVTASGDAREGLSRTAQRAKEPYGALSRGDLDALVAYLSSLR